MMPLWLNSALRYPLRMIPDTPLRGPEQSVRIRHLSSHSTVEDVLRSRTKAARENLLRKRAEFDAIVEAIEHGQADIEGATRIPVAGSELSAARNTLVDAVCELNAYLTRGIIPHDLQSGKTE